MLGKASLGWGTTDEQRPDAVSGNAIGKRNNKCTGCEEGGA